MSTDDLHLTSTSYVVLGIIEHRGPSTPYDLKVYVAASIGFFWSFPHAQLYSEPDRLVEAGLLTVRREEVGRRRKLYSITASGRGALATWVAEPTDELPEMRNPALLRLFFGWMADPEALSALAARQADAHAARLGAYQQLAASLEGVPEFVFPLSTLGLGIRYEQLCETFWREVAAAPPGAPPGPVRRR
ncbi:MAG TPA: PadR family transcriptional regulator [Actinomycetota bacterium]